MATATTNRIAKTNGKKQKDDDEIVIRSLQIVRISIPISGLTDLMMHRKPEGLIEALEKKHAREAVAKKGVRDKEAEFRGAMYVMPGSEPGKKNTRYAIPAKAFKTAMVSACRYLEGVTMTAMRGMVFVVPDDEDMVEIFCDECKMHSAPLHLPSKGGGKGPVDMRYRPLLKGWRATITVEFNSSCISQEQVVNLINIAGFSVGVGDHRPETNGPHGRWRVDVDEQG